MPRRDISGFIAHWSAASASERANAQAFLLELCDLLEVPAPDNHPQAGYFFEYPVTEHHADGSMSTGRIDLFKRACFLKLFGFEDEAGAFVEINRAFAGGAVEMVFRYRVLEGIPVRTSGARLAHQPDLRRNQ